MPRKGKVAEVSLTFGTALGSAALMYAVYPMTIVLITMAVLMAHELGHYFAALNNSGSPDLPIFLPFILGAVGMTRVRELPNLSSRAKRYIILAGPAAGIAAAVFMLPFALLSGNPMLLIAVLIAAAWELYNGTFGSDGKRWKEA